MIYCYRDQRVHINHRDFYIMFSSCSKVDKIREFIRSVYVDRQYAGGRTSEKPPRDLQAR